MSKPSPFIFTLLSDVDTPISLFHKLAARYDTACLLDSTEGDTKLARFSILGIDPRHTLYYDGTDGECHHRGESHPEHLPQLNPLAYLEEKLLAFRTQHQITAKAIHVHYADSIPFTGGWIGYLGYGLSSHFDHIPRQTQQTGALPVLAMGFYDTVLFFDHLLRRLCLLTYRAEVEAKALYQDLLNVISQPGLPPLPIQQDLPSEPLPTPEGNFTPDGFCKQVQEAKQAIVDGEVFQIVLAQRFSVPLKTDPIHVYRMIQAINPSPYGYFLKFPAFCYLGASPETFLTAKDGIISLKALAGTRPRGKTLEEDTALEQELKQNEKELAEHHMLVDLGRNDLGRVCAPGSIEVGEIASLIRYTHVMHLSTEIKGRLDSNKSIFDAFKSCFPAGTVSGAPKIRAMQLLSKLEPEQRGIYAGAVGYFDLLGNMDSAIAIRSATIQAGQAHVFAGAGLVYDSIPLQEYEETCNKAKSVLKAIHLANQTANREGV